MVRELEADPELLTRLIAAGETRRREFKRVSGKMVGKALETVSAFANTDGGLLVLGMADIKDFRGTGRLFGTQENPEAVDDLLRKLRTHFVPAIDNVSLSRLPCLLRDGSAGDLLLVQVPRSARVHSVLDDGTWTRLDAGNREMNAAEIAELMYRRGERSAESEAVDVDWSLLETPTWAEYAAARGFSRARPLPEQMGQIGLARREGERWLATRAAVLLFAEEPGGLLAAHGSRAEVRLSLYRGRTVERGATPNLRKPPRTLRGPLLRLIDETVRVVLDELAEGVDLASSGFRGRHVYPERVVKEAIVNAVIHRDYRLNRDILIRVFDDRLEVDSPGVLPGSITPANIATAGSKARNPLIVRTLREFPVPPNFDLNEGVPMMFAEMAAAHRYPPFYREATEVVVPSVTVTLLNHQRPSVWDEVSYWLDQNHEIANADLCRIAGLDTLKASKLLRLWVDQGVLEPLPNRGKRNMAYRKPLVRGETEFDLLSPAADNNSVRG